MSKHYLDGKGRILLGCVYPGQEMVGVTGCGRLVWEKDTFLEDSPCTCGNGSMVELMAKMPRAPMRCRCGQIASFDNEGRSSCCDGPPMRYEPAELYDTLKH